MDTNLYKGQLKRWNDDKGFGFIRPENGKKDIFIHISALKRMNRRPVVGEVIHYQMFIDSDGKSGAVKAKIEGVAEIKLRIRRPNTKKDRRKKDSSFNLLTIVLLVLIGFFMLKEFYNKNYSFTTSPISTISMPLEQENPIMFSCNGKVYCSEMTSCEEARFYQTNCPGTKMDGDGDGVPCESQWCGW